MLVVCEPGVYQLQTGQGPLDDDPGCGSSHCELLQQPNLATLVVVRTHPQIPPLLALQPGRPPCQLAELDAQRVHLLQLTSAACSAHHEVPPAV